MTRVPDPSTTATVSVRHCALDAIAACRPDGDGLLDDAERARAARLRAEPHRRRWIASRVALRCALGDALGCAPRALRFEVDANGRPRVVEPAGAPDFSASHSGAHGLVAIGADTPVGADVESIVAASADALARRVLAAAELAALEALPADARVARFFELWVAKEAFLKLNGTGLLVPPETVTVDVATGRVHGEDPSLVHRAARVAWLDVGADARAAIATPAPVTIRRFDWAG